MKNLGKYSGVLKLLSAVFVVLMILCILSSISEGFGFASLRVFPMVWILSMGALAVVSFGFANFLERGQVFPEARAIPLAVVALSIALKVVGIISVLISLPYIVKKASESATQALSTIFGESRFEFSLFALLLVGIYLNFCSRSVMKGSFRSRWAALAGTAAVAGVLLLWRSAVLLPVVCGPLLILNLASWFAPSVKGHFK